MPKLEPLVGRPINLMFLVAKCWLWNGHSRNNISTTYAMALIRVKNMCLSDRHMWCMVFDGFELKSQILAEHMKIRLAARLRLHQIKDKWINYSVLWCGIAEQHLTIFHTRNVFITHSWVIVFRMVAAKRQWLIAIAYVIDADNTYHHTPYIIHVLIMWQSKVIAIETMITDRVACYAISTEKILSHRIQSTSLAYSSHLLVGIN